MAEYNVPITSPKINKNVTVTQVGNLLIPHQVPYYETEEGIAARESHSTDMYSTPDAPAKTKEKTKQKRKKKKKTKKKS